MDNNFDYLHISIGSCRYGKYKVGDMVEISPEGYDANIQEFHEECFGKVTKYKNGILSVILVGEDKPIQFHPCYWINSDRASFKAWQKEKKELFIEFNFC